MNTRMGWLLKVLSKEGLYFVLIKVYIRFLLSWSASPTWKRNWSYWKKHPPAPPLKNEVPFQEILTRKRIQILHFINVCLSLVKQHWKKLAVILQKHQFSLGVYKILKNTRTVAKYCITWLMTKKLISIHVLDVG